MTERENQEIVVGIGGEAGQGLQTLQLLLCRLFVRGGWHVFTTSEFMSRIRGGSNSVTLRVAAEPVQAWRERLDLCLLLDAAALPRLQGRWQPRAVVVGEPELVAEVRGGLPLPLKEMSKAAGGDIYANSIACGFVARLAGLDLELLDGTVDHFFADSDAERRERNRAAARAGWEAGAEQAGCLQLHPAKGGSDRLLLDGSQAVAVGALAGGCNFIASYPMSPSTGVLVQLARLAREHGVVVEQAEDEIAAVNMALGSWYAGGRALVTTSGGGFDLMTEGVSLAGVGELPLVIHLAQRPGPGTGLPTRSEQGDIELARYGGHGEFPRAVLAPGSLAEACTATTHAFSMADAAQTPVIVLTDQFLLDSLHDLSALPLPVSSPESHLVRTAADYRRYAEAADGVSPRGIPGFGEGLVCVDSDEHDAGGRITEDFAVRTAMVDKRAAKLEVLRRLALPPHLAGDADYVTLIVGCGSTAGALREALAEVQPERTAVLHLPQLWPLPAAVAGHFTRAERLIVVENNATGQLARLLYGETGRRADACWLKYNGLPFSVEELVARLREEVTS